MTFLLDPDVVFLNHGSFGATPRPVFETYQQWQRQLELQPVRFVERELPGLLQSARETLGDFVGADPADLVYVPNPTFAVNTIARSLRLKANDEVLTTNHEYGACLFAWRFMSQKRGYRLVEQPISLPAASRESLAQMICPPTCRYLPRFSISEITTGQKSKSVATTWHAKRSRGRLKLLTDRHCTPPNSIIRWG